MKYSFYCKRCGWTFFSDNKSEVADARKTHQVRVKIGLSTLRACPLEEVVDGSLARASIVPAANEIAKERWGERV